jgi:hypothetical protein
VSEKEINGKTQPAPGRWFHEVKDAMQDGHVFVRWDVDAVGSTLVASLT